MNLEKKILTRKYKKASLSEQASDGWDFKSWFMIACLMERVTKICHVWLWIYAPGKGFKVISLATRNVCIPRVFFTPLQNRRSALLVCEFPFTRKNQWINQLFLWCRNEKHLGLVNVCSQPGEGSLVVAVLSALQGTAESSLGSMQIKKQNKQKKHNCYLCLSVSNITQKSKYHNICNIRSYYMCPFLKHQAPRANYLLL